MAKIENADQLERTKEWIKKWEETLTKEEGGSFCKEVHPKIHQAHIDSIKSILYSLEEQVKEYESE